MTGIFYRESFDMRALLGAAAAVLLSLALPAAAQAYEVHISITGAGQVTETTSANLVGSGCVTSATNPTGTVGIDCWPGSPGGDYGWNWDVDYVATPKPGYRFVQWQSDGSSTPGVICDRSSPAATTTTYTGATCKFRTPFDLQTRAVFVDDTNPTMNSLTGPNQSVNGAATFTFSAAADATVRGFECRVGGVHEWQGCSSGHSENPGTGSYTLEVRAYDWSDNKSSISTWQWTVDKITPETTLSPSGPSGTVSSTSASFEFTSNEQGTFTCVLDGVATPGCGSPKGYANLGHGQHTFEVQAKDAAGNLDATPATRTWTVDTAAPDTTITSGPASGSSTASKSASIGFSSEAGASFTCQLDSGPVDSSCSSPKDYAALSLGSHTVTVWARDAVGNEDPTPATRSWTISAPAGGAVGSGTSTGGGGGTTSGGGGGGGTTTTDGGVVELPAFDPRVSSAFRWRGRTITFSRLSLKSLPAGAKVRVACKGKGCKFKKRTLKVRGTKLNVLKALKRLQLRSGAVLSVTVTSGADQVKIAAWKIRRGRAPQISYRCAEPGTRLRRCS